MAKTRATRCKPAPRRTLRTLAHVIDCLSDLENQIMALSQTVIDALAAQDQKIADAAAKVDAFIAAHQSNSAADDQAIVDALGKQGASVDAIAAKLNP